MVFITLYHGTSRANAERILKDGFKTDGEKSNWKVKSKPGFVYLSTAYAPFYSMTASKGNEELAIIKVQVRQEDLYPEDDFLMRSLGRGRYTQEELNAIDLEKFKHQAKESLQSMGNAAAKPDKIVILGARFFDGAKLLVVCDPVICPENYMIMGGYYEELSEWLYQGNKPEDFKNLNVWMDKQINKHRTISTNVA